MPPRRSRDQQDDDAPPPTPLPQMMPYERASVDMLAGITRMIERQSERSRKSHEEDVAEWFRKQGPKELAETTEPLVAKRRQSERSRKSHEEDVAEWFRKQGPKELAETTEPLVAK
ncbi:hypothetical protein F511_13837 [Dorcoceras hygrometricum]|uniref:Uncharacterized protein n=1 Tax=Dorcoceras hygrometricum TaxID=472368 RepID=A0A2Z7D3L0_9LAMI|nr:hypothetical protein F511_13837 [Dorcoceras hygrometricum]